jgi:hypothetical protein
MFSVIDMITFGPFDLISKMRYHTPANGTIRRDFSPF